MGFLIISLFLLVGLQQILGRSIWSPYDFEDDLFEMPSADFHRDFIGFADDYEDLKGFMNTFSKDIDVVESKEISDIEENLNKETKLEEPESLNSDGKDEDVTTITDEQFLSDIEDMIKILQVVNVINEIMKNVPMDEINDSVEAQEEYSSKEKDLKAFEEFVNSLIELIEEENLDEDNIATTTKKDSSEEDDVVTTTLATDISEENDILTTTPATDSSEEDDVVTTTQAIDSSEEDDGVTTTQATDSSEEEYITTPKPNSDENDDNKEDEAFVYHIIDFNEPSENLDDLRYEIIQNSPYTSGNIPSFSSPLYNELDELKNIKKNLNKDTYNTIPRNSKDESLEKFENDVVVFHEKFNRFKRHINENRNAKLFYRNLVATKIKNLLTKF